MANGEPLDDLRREVDAIDDALHDLLMRRASVTEAIAQMKPRTAGRIPLALAMRPAREAEIMRRCIARHSGGPPIGTVIRVIREVLTASLAAQTPFRVHVAGDDATVDLAHEYFGAGTKLTRHASAEDVVRACAADSDSIGVVPCDAKAWWTKLAPGGPRVIAKLPFVAGDGPQAYAIAAIAQEPTGDDTTLLLADSIARLKGAGIAAHQIAEGLFAADEFVSKTPAQIISIGGYANPARVREKERVR